MSTPDHTEDMIRDCTHDRVLRVQALERLAVGCYVTFTPYDVCEACGENLEVEVFADE